MRLFIVFVTIFVAAQATNQHLSSWNSFKVQHNKQYSSLIEEQYRLHIFKTNLELIDRHNAEADLGLHSYRLGVNQFADMSHEEFAKKMLHPMKPSQTKPSQRSWEMPANVELPAAVDWREKGAVIKVIESQGNCGSCWAFTATGALEGQHFLKTKKLIRLSAQNLMDCSESFGNHGCEGGLMYNAFEYVKANKGIDSEATYPYEEKDGTCRFNRSNVAATATGYVDLPAKNETALQIALATVGPISVAVDAGHASFQFYSSGVYDEPACSTTNLDHSFVLVGYDTYKNGTVSKDYYNAKNSWGDKWGLKGYIWMSRNKKNQCGIANMGSYPTV